MIRDHQLRSIAFLLIVLITGCSGQRPLSVAEVVQNAERLDGKVIRVRGVANIWVDPSQAEMWLFGGCAIDPEGTFSEQGTVVGWLGLYDSIDPEREDLWAHGGPRDATGVKISESSFDCKGNYCEITCSPFEVVSLRAYEFVGTLRVGEDSELILENIDVEESGQFVEGTWIPIKKGNFGVFFP